MTENEISRLIVESAIEVHRTLGGPGLLESVYEDALVWELEQRNDAMTQRREEPTGGFLASWRPCAFALNESLIDDAGE